MLLDTFIRVTSTCKTHRVAYHIIIMVEKKIYLSHSVYNMFLLPFSVYCNILTMFKKYVIVYRYIFIVHNIIYTYILPKCLLINGINNSFNSYFLNVPITYVIIYTMLNKYLKFNVNTYKIFFSRFNVKPFI